MRRITLQLNAIFFVILCSGSLLGQQESKVLVVEPQPKSPIEVAIPPITSMQVNLRLDTGNGPKPEPGVGSSLELGAWLAKVSELDGLQGQLDKPWHLLLTYDVFDEDGDNVNSGVYEELWAGPRKYKRSYKDAQFHQTDYANDTGLFRLGDQRWPNRLEDQVRAEVVTPFSYAKTLTSARGAKTVRDFSGYKLDCVALPGPNRVSDPPEYCFEQGTWKLRYAHGFGWFQTTYNDIFDFQGRNVARTVTVTDGGKPHLKMRVETLETLTAVTDEEFVAPSGAVPLLGKRVSGMMMRPIKMPRFAWPASFRGRKFTVELDVVVGKDGRVASVHTASGPEDAAKICGDGVRQLEYEPYTVLGKPVEVETKFTCSYQ